MSAKVLDFKVKREESLEKKRRSFERILFQNTLVAYSVIDKEGSIYPVTLVDISRDGCLFQIPWNVRRDKKYPAETELPLRIYFTDNSYIPVNVIIRYGNEYVANDNNTYMQYGCAFDHEDRSYTALASFIEFLYLFAEHSKIDRGDSKVFFT
ncbi:MAG: PilZ domain-containing protein [Bdellovibrionales bacterium]|jgi:hypothetical protein|nr:PilZ domain-containing protein [Bdellovibrionales bacterium]MBT3526401.1 PilZ domain-containing protein [Bdellovibrionales bacterium]MBT7669369.1 PilZ domain-containing protein [Bdellovibrionales bacterium]MBT7766169.1 PilZ domain-containing protein [Bdellovibrionales bacterium]